VVALAVFTTRQQLTAVAVVRLHTATTLQLHPAHLTLFKLQIVAVAARLVALHFFQVLELLPRLAVQL
jgi:hypothetical protein